MRYQTIATLALVSGLMIGTTACSKQIAGSANTGVSESAHARTVKTGAGLDFSYAMQKPVKANTRHSVTLTIDHSYGGQNLSLTASADAAVQLATKSVSLPLAAGRNATWTIPFTATADGVYYINILGSVIGANGNSEARAYAVRVEVGDQSKNQKPAVKEVILPAEEKIS